MSRVCEYDYKVEGTNHTIKAGTKIFIPVYAIHRDPEYYPNPEKFDPERFTKTETQKRNHYTFLGFGEGPRVCIGIRFGVLQAKIGVALLLQNFKIEACVKTESPIQFANNIFILLSSKDGIYLSIKRI